MFLFKCREKIVVVSFGGWENLKLLKGCWLVISKLEILVVSVVNGFFDG